MSYLTELQDAVAQDLAARQQKKSIEDLKEATTWRELMAPLDQRLQKVLSEIPDAIKAEGLSLMAIQRLLSGRQKPKVHIGELGAAMRKLGFVRQRKWRAGAAGFRALWIKEKL